MYWIVVVGFVAILALLLSGVVLVMVLRGQSKAVPLPDGDYIVTMIGVRDSPKGVETIYRIDEPEEFRGRKVSMFKANEESS